MNFLLGKGTKKIFSAPIFYSLLSLYSSNNLFKFVLFFFSPRKDCPKLKILLRWIDFLLVLDLYIIIFLSYGELSWLCILGKIKFFGLRGVELLILSTLLCILNSSVFLRFLKLVCALTVIPPSFMFLAIVSLCLGNNTISMLLESSYLETV